MNHKLNRLVAKLRYNYREEETLIPSEYERLIDEYGDTYNLAVLDDQNCRAWLWLDHLLNQRKYRDKQQAFLDNGGTFAGLDES